MIDQATVDKIIDSANILEVVSDFVTLRKRGVNYVGLCPFHDEKTPSFSVSPSKGICKCFSCGKGGSAVHFIMEHEQLSYYEALKYLAKKYNIEIEERELSDEEKQIKSDRESMLIVNSFAQEYYFNIPKVVRSDSPIFMNEDLETTLFTNSHWVTPSNNEMHLLLKQKKEGIKKSIY